MFILPHFELFLIQLAATTHNECNTQKSDYCESGSTYHGFLLSFLQQFNALLASRYQEAGSQITPKSQLSNYDILYDFPRNSSQIPP